MSGIRIHQGTESLYVNIISVNSRYVDIIVNSDLSVDMKVPVGMNWDMIKQYIRLNEARIFQEYEKRKVRNYQALPITLDLEEGRIVYRSGLRLPFLGKMDTLLRIKYVSEGMMPVRLNCIEAANAGTVARKSAGPVETRIYMEEKAGQEKTLVIKTDNDNQEFLRYCVMRYYKQCAARIVGEKVAGWAEKMNLQYNQVSITGQRRKSALRLMKRSSQNIEIKNQLTLWGSCNKQHNLKFDWKLAMLPMEIIEYIIVHELTHLKVMNHSKAFWNEMEKVMPEYKECRNWLAKHGKEYEIF